MQHNYLSFLDYRATQRQLTARFARPRALLLHTLAFVTAMTAIWAYGTAWRLWSYQINFALPVLIGVVWSIALAAHAVVHYRRSPAIIAQREIAVEEEMRRFIQKHGEQADDDTLFALHRQLEADLEREGRWSVALLAFALVNAVSWGVSAFNVGTSWPFQTTLPLAVILIGGVTAFLAWNARRETDPPGWFTRLPLRHIAAYGAGVILLGLAGAYRMINRWDSDNAIIVWGVIVLLHILLSVVIAPLVQRFSPAEESEQPAKRKPPARLVLSDDGEMLDLEDENVVATDRLMIKRD